MTQQDLPVIDAAHFDFDIERDEAWPLPAPRKWNPAPPPTFREWLVSLLAAPFDAEGK